MMDLILGLATIAACIGATIAIVAIALVLIDWSNERILTKNPYEWRDPR